MKTRGTGDAAIGYHGTSVGAARRILSTGFEISRNDYDWLGDGSYFFQDAPARALEWARERFGADAAVIGAEIDLDDCIDLLDIPWERVILTAFQGFVAQLAAVGQPIPRQTRGAHRLDRYVVNYLVGRFATDGMVVRSVRAVFPEGKPMFPGSALLSRARVQIAVRDRSAITRIWPRLRRGDMLDPDKAQAWAEHHFKTVTREEFVANVRRFNADLARELWGDRPSAEIARERPQVTRQPKVTEEAPLSHRRRGFRGVFDSVQRSVLRLFS